MLSHPVGSIIARAPDPVYPLGASRNHSHEPQDRWPAPVYRAICDFDGDLV